MENNERVKPIYIEQVFKNKNPRVARMIPGFVYSFLKLLIHQDGINEFIEKYGDRKGLDFADGMMEYLRVTYDVRGEENLPLPEGRYIFASNHPLGGPDGVILISFLGKRYPDLKFPVNDLLLNLKNLNNIFLPVRRSREGERITPLPKNSCLHLICREMRLKSVRNSCMRPRCIPAICLL